MGYLAAPDATARRLRAFNVWLGVNGTAVVVALLMVAGIVLTVDGTRGLAEGPDRQADPTGPLRLTMFDSSYVVRCTILCG